MAKITQNVNLLMECQRRFGTKPWYNADRINALLGRLAYLDDDEIDLVLDLTERFHYLRLMDINAKLNSAFRKIPFALLQNAPRILFAPLKSPYSIEEKKREQRRKKERIVTKGPMLADPGKSCDVIFRIMQIDYPTAFVPFHQKTIICNKPMDIVNSYLNKAIIVLWDDFVGSGDTAFTAIVDLQKFLMDNNIQTIEDDYIVVCMCAMKDGVDVLSSFSLKCYASDIYSKAISDDINYSQQQIGQRVSIMKSVENKVLKKTKSSPNYSLGYHQSEALLSIMDKCPNNTFPFYWFASQQQIDPVFYRLK